MNLKFAVCDDEKNDLQYISALVSEWAGQNGVLPVIDVFPSAESFLFRYEDRKEYDILLLDIEMSGMDGVTMAKRVRKENDAVQIIFITGYSDYILEGYEVAALHYLMKPVHKEKLFSVLDRAVGKLKKNEQVLNLELPDGLARVPLYEIRFLEVRQNYVTIHAKQDYTVKKTLGAFEQELDERFFRAGRSYLVNLTYVCRVTRTDVYLSDGTSVPLSRGLYDKINRAIITRM